MAFVQVTLMKFREGVGDPSIKLMCQGLQSISKIVPGIIKFEFGPDLKIENTSMDFGLIILFENQHAWEDYRSHPKHIEFANGAMKIIERVERVQMDI
tara:strand:- start:1786 stop:2079 length:294 start_codon:yes stop_codon:yes gene_type:complete